MKIAYEHFFEFDHGGGGVLTPSPLAMPLMYKCGLIKVWSIEKCGPMENVIN